MSIDYQTCIAHGQLLISGEYLIMQGALGLALPLHYHQTFIICHPDQKGYQKKFPQIFWQQFYQKQRIFTVAYNTNFTQILLKNSHFVKVNDIN